MTDKALGLLGLGVRAGATVVGTAAVRAALKRGDLALIVLAIDRSRRTHEKVTRLAVAKGVQTIDGPNSAELGSRIGRSAAQAVGVLDPHLASGMIKAGAAKER